MLVKDYSERPTAVDVVRCAEKLRCESGTPTYIAWADERTAPRPRADLDACEGAQLAAGTPNPDGPSAIDLQALEDALDSPTVRDTPKTRRTSTITPATTPLRASLADD
jgi:hypothetical protein